MTRTLPPSATRPMLAGVLCGALSCAGSGGGAGSPPRDHRLAVYVGTYTGSGSRGIYRFELHPETGAASEPVLAGESEDLSFLALHPSRHVLYAVNEVADFRGQRTGAVSAYAIDAGTGKLAPAGHVPSGGRTPGTS